MPEKATWLSLSSNAPDSKHFSALTRPKSWTTSASERLLVSGPVPALPHQASQGSKEDSGQFPSCRLSSKKDWPAGGRKVSFVPVLYLALNSQVSGHGTGGLSAALFCIFLHIPLPQIPRVKCRQGAQNSPPQIATLRSAL